MSEKITFLGLVEKYKVEIPIIQRDYAQGREDAKTEAIREKFVEQLFEMIGDNEKSIDLDFIYGPVNGDVFVPLDGQQRLTTLFLLHWYLAHQAGELNSGDFRKKLQKFTYKVRVSTNEFLQALLAENKGGRLNFKKTPKEEIRDASWYYSIWDYDPSVQGMLNMLDEIHTQCVKINAQGLWQKLANTDKPPVTFNLLIMNDKEQKFSLTDEIYMRMNARGLALTDFENFKAWFEEECLEKEKEEFKKSWKDKIDTTWSEMFWELSGNGNGNDNELFDEALMNFFKVVAMIFAAKNSPKTKDKETEKPKQGKTELEVFLEKILKKEYISFKDYVANKCFDNESLQFTNACLDKICGNSNNIKELDVNFGECDSSIYTFKDLVLGKLNEEKLRKACIAFYAIFSFLQDKDIDIQNDAIFKRWIRTIRNLVENTAINSEKLFINAIKSVDTLLSGANSNGGDVLEFLTKHAENAKVPELETFTEQIKEEIYKSKLIADNKEFEQIFEKYENHNYFRGQIKFLLDLTEEKNDRRQEKIKEYGEKLSAIFNKKLDQQDCYLDFERALLSQGDYLIQWSSNYSFVKMKGDPNWKDHFLNKLKGNAKLDLLIDVLDQIKFNPDSDNPVDLESLRCIEFKTDTESNSEGIDNWRKLLVECPKMILGHEGNWHSRNMRWDEVKNGKTVYILKGERIYGEHAELRSLYVYSKIRELKINEFSPFTRLEYYPNPEDGPCLFFDNYLCTYNGTQYNIALNISYNGWQKEGGWNFNLFARNKALPPQLINGNGKDRLKWCDSKSCFEIILPNDLTLGHIIEETKTICQYLQR